MEIKRPSILLVEDEENLHDTLKLNLEIEGYEVTSAYNGTQALKAVENEYFDLIIMDVMMPEIDGITVTETIRLQQIESPILILSAKNTGTDRVLGLKKGADDYLTKPFNLEELILRVGILVKRSLKGDDHKQLNSYKIGDKQINFNNYELVDEAGNITSLTKKETMLLKLLIERKGEAVSREMILETVWNYDVYPSTRTIDNFILSFRKYFESDSKNPKHFHSIRGVGYKYTD